MQVVGSDIHYHWPTSTETAIHLQGPVNLQNAKLRKTVQFNSICNYKLFWNTFPERTEVWKCDFLLQTNYLINHIDVVASHPGKALRDAIHPV
jgi:hypothetical protein